MAQDCERHGATILFAAMTSSTEAVRQGSRQAWSKIRI
jgi:hypothetical protein